MDEFKEIVLRKIRVALTEWSLDGWLAVTAFSADDDGNLLAEVYGEAGKPTARFRVLIALEEIEA